MAMTQYLKATPDWPKCCWTCAAWLAPGSYLGASFGSCFAKGEVKGRDEGTDCDKHRWNHEGLSKLVGGKIPMEPHTQP